MQATEILLIRHGETIWNGEGRIQGHHDSPLSAAGRSQAEAIAMALAQEGIDVLAASDLGRALETASPLALATDLEIRVDSRLRERNYGAMQGLTWEEIERAHPEVYSHLASRDPVYAPPGGESAAAFRERVLAALAELAAESRGDRIAVVTHGGVLGIVYREAMGIPLDAPRSYAVLNASINRFTWGDAAPVLRAWGEVAHLQMMAVVDDVTER